MRAGSSCWSRPQRNVKSFGTTCGDVSNIPRAVSFAKQAANFMSASNREPMCLLETSGEVLQLFDRLRAEHPHDARLTEYLGVIMTPAISPWNSRNLKMPLQRCKQHGIKLSKIH